MSELIVSQSEQDVIHALKTSLYPGATDEAVNMVLSYCRAAQLDPMQKPVHIVSMWDSDSNCNRDVVMPGIGLYRIQASRSGEFAGMSDPEFGPDISERLGDLEVIYPEWCKITVRRLMPGGIVAEFPAVERWKENYATKNRKTTQPNAMWSKRPYGQLAKCAEAQALRKAFPEFCSQPTAEEMEGKPMAPADPVADQSDPAAKILSADSLGEATARFKIAWKDHEDPDTRKAITEALTQRKAELQESIEGEPVDVQEAPEEEAQQDGSADG